MIQRVQSLYLSIAFLFYFLYWFFGLSWYEKGYESIQSHVIFPDFLLSFTSSIPLIISIICIIAIFLFKRRSSQIQLTYIALLLSLFMCLYTILYFFFTLSTLLTYMPSMFMELLLYAAILNPFISTLFIFLAMKSIKKDRDLVNSINRLR